MKKTAKIACTILIIASISLFLLEGALQCYVFCVVRQGKMYLSDPVLGWKVKPNLNQERLTPFKEPWKLVTDGNGIRGPAGWPAGTEEKVLIIGDSYAFGDGVDLERRFDVYLKREDEKNVIVNLSVPGYGITQQLLFAKDRLRELSKGDTLIILAGYNDFYDAIRKEQVGRAKPWYELKDGEPVFHPAVIGFSNWLRDKSYIWSRISQYIRLRNEQFSQEDIRRGIELYGEIVKKHLSYLVKNGVYVLIVYHSCEHIDEKEDAVIAGMFGELKKDTGIDTLFLDDLLKRYRDAELYLGDRHWSKNGNRIVGENIRRYLNSMR